MDAEKIPQALKSRKQWVLWRYVSRDGKLTKVPFQVSDAPASSTDSATWDCFESVHGEYLRSPAYWQGLGYVLSADDPFCGIDLDACVDGSNVSPWAAEILAQFDTYAELSPSRTGIKLILEGASPLSRGRNKRLDLPEVGGKVPGIEIYDKERFFCITGARGKSCPHEPQPRQDALEALCMAHFGSEMLLDRARKYLATLEPAISGSGGSKQTCRAVCAAVKGFGLDESQALAVLRDYNARCQPPWQDKELVRKIQWVQKQDGAVGYLRDARSSEWQTIDVTLPKTTELADAMQACAEIFEGLEPVHRRVLLAGLKELVR